MTLPELCIRRPVFATVLSLVILLVGLISYQRLAVREYPRIDEPVVSGVDKGDVIVTAGQLRLRDGAPVRVAGADAARGPQAAAPARDAPAGGASAAPAPAVSPAPAAPKS